MSLRKLCLAAAVVAALTGASVASAAQMKDGVWTGEGQGRNGTITVEMTAATGRSRP